jgi:hypothetical protein
MVFLGLATFYVMSSLIGCFYGTPLTLTVMLMTQQRTQQALTGSWTHTPLYSFTRIQFYIGTERFFLTISKTTTTTNQPTNPALCVIWQWRINTFYQAALHSEKSFQRKQKHHHLFSTLLCTLTQYFSDKSYFYYSVTL